jgi:hypothetical protein
MCKAGTWRLIVCSRARRCHFWKWLDLRGVWPDLGGVRARLGFCCLFEILWLCLASSVQGALLSFELTL